MMALDTVNSLRKELVAVLQLLEFFEARNSNQEREVIERDRQLKELEIERRNLAVQLQRERGQNDIITKSFKELQDISGKLQTDVLDMDQDRMRLSSELRSSVEEKEALSKVMESMTHDQQLLRQECDKLSKASAQLDKMAALRNTVKALESENELLSKERESLEQENRVLKTKPNVISRFTMAKKLKESESLLDDLRRELAAKESERSNFIERFERLESEKMNVLRQLVTVQNELDIYQSDVKKLEQDKQNLLSERTNMNEMLSVLKEGKRSVEQKLQLVLGEQTDLSMRVENAESRESRLEEALKQSETELLEGRQKLNSMEQTLAEQTSLYEAQVNSMQRELSLRFEEMDACKGEEVSRVKARYIKMFEEKVEELGLLREEHLKSSEEVSTAKKRIEDLEYREEELERLLSRTRSSLEEKYACGAKEVADEMQRLKEDAGRAEAEVDTLRKQYEELQASYRASFSALETRLLDITAILHQQTLEDPSASERPTTDGNTVHSNLEDSLAKDTIETRTSQDATKKHKKVRRKSRKSKA